jgi:enoyl-CoA hydratase
MTDKILSKVEDGIGWVIYNNPEKHNAMSLAMSTKVAEVMEGFGNNDDVRVVVLKGNGGKSFVSGADISEFEKLRSTPEGIVHYERTANAQYERIHDCPKPVIAMIKGYCMGGGMAVACAADIRICSDDSVFAIPAGRLGIGYRPSFTRWVYEAVGASTTKEILFTARRYKADEAFQLGLVNRVTGAEELQAYTIDYAKTIAGNAPLSVQTAKLIVNEIVKSPSDWDDELCKRLVEDCSNSEDYKEGRRAFAEKRQPVFTGK